MLVLEAGTEEDFGGNSRYTAGAMRFAFPDEEALRPLLATSDDSRIARSDFGSYPESSFLADLTRGQAEPANDLQHTLVSRSRSAVAWLCEQGVTFEPIYSRQAFERDGRFRFYGGLVLAARGEGEGLVSQLAQIARVAGVETRLGCRVTELITENGRIVGVRSERSEVIHSGAVVLACGGFEANASRRAEHLGSAWRRAVVRGTPFNRGDALAMAEKVGAAPAGDFAACHAVCMDVATPDFRGSKIPHTERRKFRKISYPFGVMLNAEGRRFVDEGADFRNYTYAQYGRAVLEQPGGFAWQVFDARCRLLLYDDYTANGASRVQADTLEALCAELRGVDAAVALETLRAYNRGAGSPHDFDPTQKDACGTRGVVPPKSNWAVPLADPPFEAFQVTCGITFTYGGVRIDPSGRVLRSTGEPIPGLYAAGEAVGGVFFSLYPGGSGLTAGAVFGRSAGFHAARERG